MLRCVCLVLAIAFSAAGAPVGADVRGVWKITELASSAPGAEWEVRALRCRRSSTRIRTKWAESP